MVSIRRRNPQAATTSSHRKNHFLGCCNIWTCRNILLAFITLQSLNLAVRILQRISTVTTPISVLDAAVLQQQQEERLKRDGEFQFKKNNENEVVSDSNKKDDITDSPPEEEQGESARDEIEIEEEGEEVGGILEEEVDEEEEEEEPEEEVGEEEVEEEKEEGRVDDKGKDDEGEKDREREEEAEAEEERLLDDPDNIDNKGQDGEKKKIEALEPVGATASGFIIDLVSLRQQPDFRRHQKTLLSSLLEVDSASSSNHLSIVSQLAGGIPLKSCDYVDSVESASSSTSSKRLLLLQRAVCRNDPSTHLIAYNPASFPRYVCGRTIAPKGELKLDRFCKEPVRLFPFQELAGVSSEGVLEGAPPIVVKSYLNQNSNPELEAVECNVPCQFEQNLPHIGERTIDGTTWKLIVNDGDPASDEKAQIELTAFKRDEYYSTMSLSSSVPLTQYSFDLYDLRNRPSIDWNEAENAATFILDSDCYDRTLRRHKWYAAMEAAFPTRSYGQCQHNTDVMPGGEESTSTLEGRLALAKRNRIILAFETSPGKDYATSITWESLLSGAVPALLGARNANDFLPKHSTIFASNFNNWDAFALHVKNISEDKQLWESYQSWRTDETELRNFEERFNFTRTSPQCRTCRWAYSKLYGLGWNHQQQQVQETHISRKLCWSSDNDRPLVVQPFREAWGRSSVVQPWSTSEACQTTEITTATIEQDGYKVERSVMQHDGVVDLEIHSSETMSSVPTTDLVLRFHFQVRNLEGAYFPHSHTLVETTRGALCSSASIQDGKSKVSVLASWETIIRSPEQGVIEVVVLQQGEKLHADEIRRIRVITEDFNMIHDKLTEYFPSWFAKQMTIDFIDPVELYYEDS